jgi:RHS repeat-associated protein
LTFDNGYLSGSCEPDSFGIYSFGITAVGVPAFGDNTYSVTSPNSITVIPPPVPKVLSVSFPPYSPPTATFPITISEEILQYTRFTQYDAEGNTVCVTEVAAGGVAPRPEATVRYAFDRLGRMVGEESRGVKHTFEYDLGGNTTRASYGSGRQVDTTYDALNRPLQMTETSAVGATPPRVTTYGYDKAGKAITLTSANGQVTQNAYDAAGHLVSRWLYKDSTLHAAGIAQSQFAWTYDAIGNVKSQVESWPGMVDRAGGIRTTSMSYDAANRLITESIDDPVAAQDVTTTYSYDAANNRTSKLVSGGGAVETGYWTYTHNVANQLTGWKKWTGLGGTELRSAALTYDANGNRTSQVIGGQASTSGVTPQNAANGTTSYTWDLQNRLIGVAMPSGRTFEYQYDYRGRRVGIHEAGTGLEKYTAVVFSEGLSVAEYGSTTPITTAPVTAPLVQYVRGTDMGGGIGGMLYTLRDAAGVLVPKYDLSNGRGDIVAQSDSSAELTWTASYEAFGRRTTETGANEDKQRANSKDEDPTGLLNEGFRYRDLETGVFLSRDPAGTVDGPNVYTYVQQNPWTKYDPEGLFWHIAAGAGIGALWGVGSQIVSDCIAGKVSSASDYASAAVGGAVTGGTLAATGNPTLAGAAGGAAASATGQLVSHGTVDGGQVLKDAAVGAASGGLGAGMGKAIGCGANKALKALGGAAVDATTGAGAQVVSNVLEGKPAGEGVAAAALDHAAGGVGLVAAVQSGCFLPGTSVTLGTGDHQAIETLHIGQRVSTPESSHLAPRDEQSVMASRTEVDPATWRSYKVSLRDALAESLELEVTLLRPQGWMAEHSRRVAGRREVWVDFEELNAKGWAEVIEERACPVIEAGPGKVITATITRPNEDVRTLTLTGGETLHVTGSHRMYSASRQDWVAVRELEIGEELRTAEGRKAVASLGFQRGRHQVYNLEVEDEHCYFVGSGEVLSHNAADCKTAVTDTDRIKDELPEGDRRTPEENKKARNYFKNNKEEAKADYTKRTGEKWPADSTYASHERSLKEGGHPLKVVPGYGGANSDHMKPGPDGKTDHQRWGSEGGKASAAKRKSTSRKRR